MDLDRIAIIGAGPCGLAAAKYLLAEQKFETITIFEQRSQPGGVWNYTGDEGINGNASTSTTIRSPVYDSLETNIPNSLMQFCETPFPPGTALFPSHCVVKEYLHRYAEELRPYVNLGAEVVEVLLNREDQGQKPEWNIKSKNLLSGIESTTQFDAVIVANGHHNVPIIPGIPGLEGWETLYPGSIIHSSAYRRSETFRDKKVIVIGHSASGIDIAAQVSRVSKQPILISERTPRDPTPLPALTSEEVAPTQVPPTYLPEITHLNPATRTAYFSNGHVESDIDAIIFCTGYYFSAPFLSNLEPPIITDGARPHNLYKHVFYTAEPTLAFIGTPQRIVPFPFSQAQASWIARVFSGRLDHPSSEEMNIWVVESDSGSQSSSAGAGSRDRDLNSLAFPLDAEYINSLYELCMSAMRKEGLENEGRGKRPPYWGDKERWTRENFPAIKRASQMLGERRKEVTTLEELGFYYEGVQASL
ncbi:uncharacterized protein BDV14DRAFT_190492 [Aspergillus stella-maris]|uniref:uncharacterized protein n=1 Tax=Aspergillus stella-maris TaxID=1810926 RepID=UPI003CCD15DA